MFQDLEAGPVPRRRWDCGRRRPPLRLGRISPEDVGRRRGRLHLKTRGTVLSPLGCHMWSFFFYCTVVFQDA